MSHNKNDNPGKLKVEKHMISRVPALHALFQLAERDEKEITNDKFNEAVSNGLSSVDRDGNYTCHLATLNSAILGFSIGMRVR